MSTMMNKTINIVFKKYILNIYLINEIMMFNMYKNILLI